MATGTDGRIGGLDSIRGLAALSVVLMHSLSIFPAVYAIAYLYLPLGSGWTFLISSFPVHLAWSGHEAVIMSSCSVVSFWRCPGHAAGERAFSHSSSSACSGSTQRTSCCWPSPGPRHGVFERPQYCRGQPVAP